MTDEQLKKARFIQSMQREISVMYPLEANIGAYAVITVMAGGIDKEKYNEWLAAQKDELQKQFDAL